MKAALDHIGFNAAAFAPPASTSAQELTPSRVFDANPAALGSAIAGPAQVASGLARRGVANRIGAPDAARLLAQQRPASAQECDRARYDAAPANERNLDRLAACLAR
jgi:hypothetical protein